MGARRACRAVFRLVAPFLMVFACISGCQMTAAPMRELVEYREQVNDHGLTAPREVAALKISASLPPGWREMKLQKHTLYSHKQWRSQSKRTAVGVTYIRMPLPFSPKTLAWLASREVGKSTTGEVLRRWTDDIGREWFEAVNDKYHVTGYVMTRGSDAWINYAGWRVSEPKEEEDVALANRALETVLPVSVAALEDSKSAVQQVAAKQPE